MFSKVASEIRVENFGLCHLHQSFEDDMLSDLPETRKQADRPTTGGSLRSPSSFREADDHYNSSRNVSVPSPVLSYSKLIAETTLQLWQRRVWSTECCNLDRNVMVVLVEFWWRVVEAALYFPGSVVRRVVPDMSGKVCNFLMRNASRTSWDGLQRQRFNC